MFSTPKIKMLLLGAAVLVLSTTCSASEDESAPDPQSGKEIRLNVGESSAASGKETTTPDGTGDNATKPSKCWFALDAFSITSLSLAIFVPWFLYEGEGMRDADILASVSQALAHWPKLSLGLASAGVSVQLFNTCYFWRKEVKDELSSDTADDEDISSGCCQNKSRKKTKSCLLNGSMTFWFFGQVGAWFTALFPMGGKTNALHYPTAIAFFVFSTLSMLLFSIYECKFRKQNNKMGWLFALLTIISLGFLASSTPLDSSMNWFKISVDDCKRLSNGTDREHNVCKESIKGDQHCVIQNPSYPGTYQTMCDYDIGGIDLTTKEGLDEATNLCNDKTNCDVVDGYKYTVETGRKTGWKHNAPVCENVIESKRGGDDSCAILGVKSEAEMTELGSQESRFISESEFKKKCLDLNNNDDNEKPKCKYTPSSTSEKSWTTWVALQLASLGSIFAFPTALCTRRYFYPANPASTEGTPAVSKENPSPEANQMPLDSKGSDSEDGATAPRTS